MGNFPCLELTFAADGGHQLLVNASFRLDEKTPASRKLVVDPPRGKQFRALCILMLLAKYRGDSFADKDGILWFRDRIDSLTWIKTLGINAGKGTLRGFCQKYFSQCNFISASRGDRHIADNKKKRKGTLPCGKYHATGLPFRNVLFYKAPAGSNGENRTPITGEALGRFAEMLERYEAVKPKGKGWQAIVPAIIAETQNDRPLKLTPKTGKELTEESDDRRSFLLTTHWRTLNEDVRREIKDKSLGGDWYVVSVVPNWVGDWKPLFCEAIAKHQAKVRIAYQAASAADGCPAIRAQLRINSSWVKEKNHAAVVKHVKDRIEDMKIEMGHWITEIQERSGRGKNATGAFEFFESHLNHPFMAVLGVPAGTKRGSKSAAPAGTWCVLGLYPFYRTVSEKCCSVYLNGDSPVLDFYYNTIVDLFESGIKDGYLKPVDLLKKSRARKSNKPAGSP
jgi:hypothetical protein